MDWFDTFLITGSIFFGIQILRFIVTVIDLIHEWYMTRRHDQYCEDCADELMAETFKSMRERDND